MNPENFDKENCDFKFNGREWVETQKVPDCSPVDLQKAVNEAIHDLAQEGKVVIINY